MALLAIVQGAALRCNVPSPAAAIGVPDTNVQKLIAFAQDSGDELAERWKWLPNKSAATFTGDGVTTVFTFPTDFDTLSPSDTFVSSIYPLVPLVGPINEDALLVLKGLPYTTTPAVWRRLGVNQVEFYPAPADQEVISLVYSALTWITDLNGIAYNPVQWMADTDLSRIPERLIRLGTIWRFKRSNGLNYTQEFDDYERSFDRKSGQENQERVIAMSSSIAVGDTFFPGTIADLSAAGTEG